MSELFNLRIRRGNTRANDNYTGLSGEITYDTDRKQIRSHDGITRGGIPVANATNVSPGVIGPNADTYESDTVQIPFVEVTDQGVVVGYGVRTHTIHKFNGGIECGLVAPFDQDTMGSTHVSGTAVLRSDGKWYDVITHAENDINSKISATNSTFNKTINNVSTTLTNNITTLRTEFESTSISHSTSLTNLDTRVTASESNITDLKNVDDGILARVGANEVSIGNHTTSISNLDSRVSGTETSITALNSADNAILVRVGANEVSIENHGVSLSEHNTSISNLLQRVSALESENETLKQQVAVLQQDAVSQVVLSTISDIASKGDSE